MKLKSKTKIINIIIFVFILFKVLSNLFTLCRIKGSSMETEFKTEDVAILHKSKYYVPKYFKL
jgi:signal peptidase I